MNKTFEDAKANDKIYLISIKHSMIYEYPQGNKFRELKISSMVKYTTDAYINLSDGITTIRPKRHMPYYAIDKTEDEIDLSADIYALTKKDCINAAMKIINERKTQLNAIEKRCKEVGFYLNDTKIMLEKIEIPEEEPSLEEFASMALG